MKHKAIIRFLCPSLSHFWSLIPDPSPLSHLQITYNWNLKVFNSASKFVSSVLETFFLNILIVMRDIYFPSSINCSVPLSLMTITVGLTLRPSWHSRDSQEPLFSFCLFSSGSPRHNPLVVSLMCNFQESLLHFVLQIQCTRLAALWYYPSCK